MKRNIRHFVRYWPALISVATLALVIVACAPTSSPTPASTPSATSAPSPTTSAPARTRGPGASGNITRIDGNILTLTTAQGQVMVNVGANTSFQKTVTGTLSDLQQGQSLMVIGTRDASGNIVATSINIRPQGQGARSSPPAGVIPGLGGRPAKPGNGTNPRLPNDGTARASGTLTKIDGNTLTLTTAQGQVTVNVGANTSIQKTATGTLSDLQQGQSLMVIGARDVSGNIAATSIIIRPQGQSAPSNPPGGA